MRWTNVLLATAAWASAAAALQVEPPARGVDPGQVERNDTPARPVAGDPPPPPLPDRVGCYVLERREWRDAPCVSAEEHYRSYPKAKVPPLPALLIKKYVAAADGGIMPRAAWTRVAVTLPVASGDTDSTFGPGNWNVQNNTNFFPAPNGHYAAVQFLDVSSAKWGDEICIGQVDATADDYSNILCQHAKRQDGRRLKAGDRAMLVGGAYIGKTGKHMLYVDASVTWTWKLQAHFGVVAEDHLGLWNHWIATSGGILGLGNSSNLSFTKAIAKTAIEAVGCWQLGQHDFPACKNGYPLNKYMQPATYEITGETNNLVKAQVPVSAPFFWNAPDYVSRAVLHATPGACLDAVVKSKGKTLSC